LAVFSVIGFKKDFDKEFHKIQKDMLTHVEQLAAINGNKLDYTEATLGNLDKMLDGIAQELEDAGVREDRIETNESAQGIAEAVGCYIAESIERAHGKGRWLQDENGYGFVSNSGLVIYPMIWVMKKLLNPPGYSVAETYREWSKGR
jgi:hypothetical protein